MRPPRASVTALVVAVALTGCSGSEREPTAEAGIPREIINGVLCPLAGPSLPTTAGCETSVAGDFDGDGEDDRATVLYHSGATRVPKMFVLDGEEVVPVTSDTDVGLMSATMLRIDRFKGKR